MHFTQIAIVSLFGALTAATSLETRQFNACSGAIYSVASCCDVAVEQILGITCDVAHQTPGSAGEFTDICASRGQDPQCCAFPIVCLSSPLFTVVLDANILLQAGEAVGCHPPVGEA